MSRLPVDRRQSTWLDHSALVERPLPDRLDVDYDDPEPLEWHELANPLLWLAAIAVLVGLGAFCALVIAVLSPVPAQ